jgi:hypothetical protein
LEPVAIQIAARQKALQDADDQGFIRICKVLYRTLVMMSMCFTQVYAQDVVAGAAYKTRQIAAAKHLPE